MQAVVAAAGAVASPSRSRTRAPKGIDTIIAAIKQKVANAVQAASFSAAAPEGGTTGTAGSSSSAAASNLVRKEVKSQLALLGYALHREHGMAVAEVDKAVADLAGPMETLALMSAVELRAMLTRTVSELQLQLAKLRQELQAAILTRPPQAETQGTGTIRLHTIPGFIGHIYVKHTGFQYMD